MENKQTAVEWLFEQLWETPKDKFNWYAIRKQAKEIEREEIEEAYNEGCTDGAKRRDSKNGIYRSSSDYFTKKYQNGKEI
jgi:hypothetical protein